MSRAYPRTRHPISPRHVWRLKVCGFRYSRTREAYVLRVVGRRIGPVFQARESPVQPHSDTDDSTAAGDHLASGGQPDHLASGGQPDPV
jgi:hypothetical protein